MSADLHAVIIQAADDLASTLAKRFSLLSYAHSATSSSAATELASIVGAAGAAEGVLRMVAAMLAEPPAPTPTVRIDVPRDEHGRFARSMRESLADAAQVAERMTGPEVLR